MGWYWNLHAEYRDSASAPWKSAPVSLWGNQGQGYLRHLIGWDDERYKDYPQFEHLYERWWPEGHTIDWTGEADEWWTWEEWVDGKNCMGWWSLRELMEYDWTRCDYIAAVEHEREKQKVYEAHGVEQLIRGGWFQPNESLALQFWKQIIEPLKALVGERLDDARVIFWIT